MEQDGLPIQFSQFLLGFSYSFISNWKTATQFVSQND